MTASAPHPNGQPARETPPPGHDPDWPSDEELRDARPDEPGVFRWFLLAIAVFIALVAASWLCSCATPPPPGAWDAATNAAARAVSVLRGAADDAAAGDTVSPGAEAPPATSAKTKQEQQEQQEQQSKVRKFEDSGTSAEAGNDAPAGAGPAPGETRLSWCWGGFNGSRAVEDSACRISSLKVGSSGLSLKWETGVPGDWAVSRSEDKGELVIVAFFIPEGKGGWKGGKFDWINAARSTRSLDNVLSGYGGWSASEFRAARKHALCVVSADGRKRSNLIED